MYHGQKSVIDVSIVGMGARGLSILERLVAFSRFSKHLPKINVFVFDDQPFGSGCHSTAQPEHLLVNTVASQMTVFSDHTVQGSGYVVKGPTFYDWLYEFSSLETVDPNGYYPRKLLGAYLEWSFDYLCRLAKGFITVHMIRQSVVSLEPCSHPSHQGWRVCTHNGLAYTADYIFITTGHENARVEGEQPMPSYPLDAAVRHIQPNESVAIEGMGLSMFDVVSMLTTGRGGIFTQQGQGLMYTPSGQEPKIWAYSRSGLPLLARARNQKELREQYKPHFLTQHAVQQLKGQHGQLDFEAHVLPLLLKDMAFAYSLAFVRKRMGIQESFLFANAYLNHTDTEEVIAQYIPISERFDWVSLASPLNQDALVSREIFKSWLMAYVQLDIERAMEGNLSNPMKTACDVLRDLRDNLRYAIDFSGLTPKSHQQMFEYFLPVMNRLAVGPPLRRSQEMLALVQSGILCIDLGPQVKRVYQQGQKQPWVLHTVFGEEVRTEHLITARIAMPKLVETSNPLLRQLLDKGIIRPFHNGTFHPCGLDITEGFNPIDSSGAIHKTIFVLGTPVEGAKFYTFILPRPFVNSTALVDADRAVSALFADFKQRYGVERGVEYVV
ncbi:MAG: FAD/NAD(P)-binding protein [Formosimonas sp.]